MITFRQKEFSEYDAMRGLYVELMRLSDRSRFDIIDKGALLPILKGNNIVVERFVITTSFFGRDRYRMYLKIGAKAKMPDEVRLPEKVYDKRLGDLSININAPIFSKRNNEPQEKTYGKGGPPPAIQANLRPNIDLSYEVRELLGKAIKYDKKSRSLVIEFASIPDAIRALNILPFGIGYKIYLLG